MADHQSLLFKLHQSFAKRRAANPQSRCEGVFGKSLGRPQLSGEDQILQSSICRFTQRGARFLFAECQTKSPFIVRGLNSGPP
ncbi:hypothetical protein SJ05684_b52360 (plasmid) [Sinorhizobium sojae CCBAU 05684]|uniref:Uncharacterized protein n=1 Tax=Sinorhizobium sojae CCBAU 05684 TaxID=716928 RepID=A0A249PJW8_9HYPH|nr:hypothetical protein SJ05684_b52360 [Sinorhizobium sojae CCBAU 05684]